MAIEVRYIITVDDKGAIKTIKAVGDEANKSGEKGKSSGTSMSAAWGKVTGAIAAVYAGYKSLGSLINAVDVGSKVTNQANAFSRYASSFGLSSDKIIESLKDVSNQTVDTTTLIEKAGTAMLLGIPGDKLADLMSIARSTSKITGQTVSEAFGDIALAVGRQSKMILDNLGIIINLDQAYDSYAKKLGIASSQLTEAEKKQAFLNATLEAGAAKAKAIGNTSNDLEGFTKLVISLKNSFNELANTVATILNPVLEGLSAIIDDILGSIKTEKQFNLMVNNPVDITKFKSIQATELFIKKAKEEQLVIIGQNGELATETDRYKELATAINVAEHQLTRLTNLRKKGISLTDPTEAERYKHYLETSSVFELTSDQKMQLENQLKSFSLNRQKSLAVSLDEQEKAEIDAAKEVERQLLTIYGRDQNARIKIEYETQQNILAIHEIYNKKRYDLYSKSFPVDPYAYEVATEEQQQKMSQRTAENAKAVKDALEELQNETTLMTLNETDKVITELEIRKQKMLATMVLTPEERKSIEDQWNQIISLRKQQIDPLANSFKDLGGEIQSSLNDAFKGLIKGTESFSDAVMKLLDRISDKMMDMVLNDFWKFLFPDTGGGGGFGNMLMTWGPKVIGALGGAFGGAAGGLTAGQAAGVASGAFSLATAAKGGIFPGGFRKFGTGGIANQPTLGLVGEGGMNEAMVTLPDDRSIPVKMKGGVEQPVYNINISAMDSKSFMDFAKRNPQVFSEMISSQINKGNSSLISSLNKAVR